MKESQKMNMEGREGEGVEVWVGGSDTVGGADQINEERLNTLRQSDQPSNDTSVYYSGQYSSSLGGEVT